MRGWIISESLNFYFVPPRDEAPFRCRSTNRQRGQQRWKERKEKKKKTKKTTRPVTEFKADYQSLEGVLPAITVFACTSFSPDNAPKGFASTFQGSIKSSLPSRAPLFSPEDFQVFQTPVRDKIPVPKFRKAITFAE